MGAASLAIANMVALEGGVLGAASGCAAEEILEDVRTLSALRSKVEEHTFHGRNSFVLTFHVTTLLAKW